MSTKPVSLRLSDDLRARLEAIAETQDRTPHYLIKKAVETYLETAEREQAELRVLDERWAEYQRTGVSASVAEVKSALAKHRQGQDAA